ncbi:TnsA endonuclease-like protein [Bacillus sp. V-88]|nr:hypothetical protein B1B00_16840 [Bacillus sp. DSM 27956]PRX72843.1 TnsA endonuclease-like protein [Bacillus sp. V-88]SLK24194.1 TnsA endonuclease C terminal [Bacillus sp. V-88]
MRKDYLPVRKVNNKNSRNVPHNTGSFFSYKMEKEIAYESLSECYFYLFLDLNKDVERYYPQPVKIRIPVYSAEGNIEYWDHVPDVLVFWNIPNKYPTLFQVKYIADFEEKKQQIVNMQCVKYANKHNWEYKVVEIININRVFIKNIKFLHSHLKERRYFKEIIPDINSVLSKENNLTIEGLSSQLSSRHNELFILPTIYYLLAKGEYSFNLFEPIGLKTKIFRGPLIFTLKDDVDGGALM